MLPFLTLYQMIYGVGNITEHLQIVHTSSLTKVEGGEGGE